MATYAIGDLQGCYKSLMGLLEKIDFSSNEDKLWFTGDLVNRGPDSLSCLRFVHSLGSKALTVLGNHDLHLLAVSHGAVQPRKKDTLEAIIDHKKARKYLDWLQTCPLLHHDKSLSIVLTHAGIPPQWSLKKAKKLAGEVETTLKTSDSFISFFKHMYGNEPAGWSDQLEGVARQRTITNYFTRMRLLDANNALNFNFKSELAKAPKGYQAWFDAKRDQDLGADLVFGHWAALMGKGTPKGVYAIDTGCGWGNQLTALRLEDKKHFSVPNMEN